MRRYVLLLVLLSIVAGCGAKTPSFQIGDDKGAKNAVYVLNVVSYVRCELGEAVLGEYGTDTQWLSNWSAAIDLTLLVDEKSTLTPTATYNDYLSNHYKLFTDGTEITGSRTQGAAASGSAVFDAQNNLKITWYEDFRELMDNRLRVRAASAKRGEPVSCTELKGLHIRGDLKIKDALRAGILPAVAPDTMSRQNTVTGPLKVIEHHVTFQTDVTAGITPSLKLFNTSAGIGASGLRSRKDDLLISMGPVAEPTKPGLRTFGGDRSPSQEVLFSKLAAQIGVNSTLGK